MQQGHFDETIMIAPGSDYGRAMWADLATAPKCTLFDYVIDTDNRVLNLLHHAHFSFAVNKRLPLPLQGIWRKRYVLEKVPFDDEKRYCVIYTDVSACRTDVGYLRELSKRPNLTLILVLVNVLATKERLLRQRLDCFRLVFSFDLEDCRRYGFIYHPTFYSVQPELQPGEVESDAFFVGAAKGNRHEKLRELYRRMKAEGMKADFYLVNVGKNEPREEGIHYNEPLSYAQVLHKVLHTNCVVEIMGGGQTGLTLRAMEAVCYNRRLLTDNASVKEQRYYDTGFLRYEERIEQADLGFVRERRPVDYAYAGEYSPIHLLSHIEQELSNDR